MPLGMRKLDLPQEIWPRNVRWGFIAFPEALSSPSYECIYVRTCVAGALCQAANLVVRDMNGGGLTSFNRANLHAGFGMAVLVSNSYSYKRTTPACRRAVRVGKPSMAISRSASARKLLRT